MVIETKNKSNIIYVDADACPVKQELVDIAADFQVRVIFVASHAHMTDQFPNEKWVYVDSVQEAVDLYIMNKTSSGDVVVTQDIGLASTLLLKGVAVISPRGIIFSESDMAVALHGRYLAAKERRRGKYGKGPKPLTAEDKKKFAKSLINILSSKEKE